MHAIFGHGSGGFGAHEEVHIPTHVAVNLCLIMSRKGRVRGGIVLALDTTQIGAGSGILLLVDRIVQGREGRFSVCPFTDRRVFRDGQPLPKILHGGVLVGKRSLLTPPPGRESGGPLFAGAQRGVRPQWQGGAGVAGWQ